MSMDLEEVKVQQIALFVTDIRLNYSCNKSVVSAFLDINSAYDNVVLSILSTYQYNCSSNTKYVKFYFEHFIVSLRVYSPEK